MEGIFKFEDDLLKHHVRTEAWLPVCRNRLKHVRDSCPPRRIRRLKYFTFTAVGAIDVLMLDVARIIRQSRSGFDTVYFFDRTPELVVKTRRTIPGAIGFPGNFVDVVLMDDPVEDSPLHGYDILDSPTNERNELSVTHLQTQRAQQRDFFRCFPFDVINLDLEEFLFKPKDPLPGRLVNAFRRVFAWQRKPLRSPLFCQELDGFSLMFTTQIGPKNIGTDYLLMLREQLEANITANATLRDIFIKRTGHKTAISLQNKNFDAFFKLAVPKVLMSILMEEDWYVDPSLGISMYEFERPSLSGPYKILHMVMDIKRKNPSKERRAPGVDCKIAVDAYNEIVCKMFSENEVVLTDAMVNAKKLMASLEAIKGRRKKYYPDEI